MSHVAVLAGLAELLALVALEGAVGVVRRQVARDVELVAFGAVADWRGWADRDVGGRGRPWVGVLLLRHCFWVGLVNNDMMDMGMRSFNIGICYFRLFL